MKQKAHLNVSVTIMAVIYYSVICNFGSSQLLHVPFVDAKDALKLWVSLNLWALKDLEAVIKVEAGFPRSLVPKR